MKRRGFLGALLAVAAAPAIAGFLPTPVARAVSKYINVRDYGAMGDGVTNDGPALRRAMAAAGDGGTVILPAGSYAVGPGFSVAANVTLRGSCN